jgi:hypothetical protein
MAELVSLPPCDSTRVKAELIDEIVKALETLDTSQVRIVRTMVCALKE